MRKMQFVAASVVALVVFVAASPAHAGGWATSGLDAVPAPVAWEPVDVGFTIRQHGMTPVLVEGPVTVEITAAEEDWHMAFPATPDGPEGHYVALVTFPTEGSFTWLVNQG